MRVGAVVLVAPRVGVRTIQSSVITMNAGQSSRPGYRSEGVLLRGFVIGLLLSSVVSACAMEREPIRDALCDRGPRGELDCSDPIPGEIYTPFGETPIIPEPAPGMGLSPPN